MAEYYVAICLTVKAESAEDATKKVTDWMTRQGLPKWALDHYESEAQEADE